MSDLAGWLQLARDPTTSAAELTRLARLPEPAVWFALADNPGSPLELLLQLAVHTPDRVVANPALELAALSDPQRLLGASPQTLQQLVRCPGLPRSVAELLAQHPLSQIAGGLWRHPALSEQTRIRLLSRIAPAQLVQIEPARLDDPAVLNALARHPAPEARVLLASRPELSAALLGQLLVDAHPLVRRAAARRAPTHPVCRLLHEAGASPLLTRLERAPGAPRAPLAGLRLHLEAAGGFARLPLLQDPDLSDPGFEALFLTLAEERPRSPGLTAAALLRPGLDLARVAWLWRDRLSRPLLRALPPHLTRTAYEMDVQSGGLLAKLAWQRPDLRRPDLRPPVEPDARLPAADEREDLILFARHRPERWAEVEAIVLDRDLMEAIGAADSGSATRRYGP